MTACWCENQFVKKHLLGVVENLPVRIWSKLKLPGLGQGHDNRKPIDGLPIKRAPVTGFDFVPPVRIQHTAKVLKQSFYIVAHRVFLLTVRISIRRAAG